MLDETEVLPRKADGLRLRSGTMQELLRRFVGDQSGQDLIEYAMLVSLIALSVIAGVTSLGTNIDQKYSTLASAAQFIP
jgi:pilus assembly protein Flp/PilA